LVFDSYGGYADETIRFLETIVMGMSKNDDMLAASIFRNFRNRTAIAHHRGQCKVINYSILPRHREE